MKINVEECKSVLADLEKASEPDGGLEARICRVLGLDGYPALIGGIPFPGIIPPLTSSLDATIALVERVLPGWAWSVFDDGHAWLWPDQKRDLLAGFQARVSTPPLALLTALFRALIAQMEKAE